MSAALLVMLAIVPASALRVQALLGPDRHKMTHAALTADYFEGTFFNMLLPTGVGGDLIRALRIGSREVEGKRAFALVVAERVMGFATMGVLAAIGAPFIEVPTPLRLMAYAMAVGAIVGSIVLFSGTGIEWLRDRLPGGWAQGILDYAGEFGEMRREGTLPRAFGITLVLHVTLVTSIWLAGLAIGCELQLLVCMVLVPMVIVASLAPSLGGLGVREGAFVVLFTQAGLTQEQALSLGVAYLAMALCQAIVGGVVYLLR